MRTSNESSYYLESPKDLERCTLELKIIIDELSFAEYDQSTTTINAFIGDYAMDSE